jgi:hypothetical protein
MNSYYKYKYSVTVSTNDEAVLHCLRSLSMFAQTTGLKTTPCLGTGARE